MKNKLIFRCSTPSCNNSKHHASKQRNSGTSDYTGAPIEMMCEQGNIRRSSSNGLLSFALILGWMRKIRWRMRLRDGKDNTMDGDNCKNDKLGRTIAITQG